MSGYWFGAANQVRKAPLLSLCRQAVERRPLTARSRQSSLMTTIGSRQLLLPPGFARVGASARIVNTLVKNRDAAVRAIRNARTDAAHVIIIPSVVVCAIDDKRARTQRRGARQGVLSAGSAHQRRRRARTSRVGNDERRLARAPSFGSAGAAGYTRKRPSVVEKQTRARAGMCAQMLSAVPLNTFASPFGRWCEAQRDRAPAETRMRAACWRRCVR